MLVLIGASAGGAVTLLAVWLAYRHVTAAARVHALDESTPIACATTDGELRGSVVLGVSMPASGNWLGANQLFPPSVSSSPAVTMSLFPPSAAADALASHQDTRPHIQPPVLAANPLYNPLHSPVSVNAVSRVAQAAASLPVDGAVAADRPAPSVVDAARRAAAAYASHDVDVDGTSLPASTAHGRGASIVAASGTVGLAFGVGVEASAGADHGSATVALVRPPVKSSEF